MLRIGYQKSSMLVVVLQISPDLTTDFYRDLLDLRKRIFQWQTESKTSHLRFPLLLDKANHIGNAVEFNNHVVWLHM